MSLIIFLQGLNCRELFILQWNFEQHILDH